MTLVRLGIIKKNQENQLVKNALLGFTKMMKNLRIVKNAPLEKVTVGQQDLTSACVSIVKRGDSKDLLGLLIVRHAMLGEVNPMKEKPNVSIAPRADMHKLLGFRSGKILCLIFISI